MDRDFKVSSKGMKKKHTVAFLTLETVDGEKLTLHFEAPSMLKNFEIDQEFTIKILEGAQKKLAGK